MVKEKAKKLLLIILLATIVVIPLIWQTPIDFLKDILEQRPLYAPIIFVFIEIIAITVAPITTLPLLPLAVSILGPLQTAILSIIGWVIGGTIAFLIAKHLGRPVLEKFVSLKTIEKYEKKINPDSTFITIVVLRLIFPIDIISYALGFFSKISLFRYVLASLIGFIPHAFISSYAGEALLLRDIKTLFIWVIILLALVLLGRYIFRRLENN